MAGIASGAISGGNGTERLANASIGMQVAENAVENNFLEQAMENPNNLRNFDILYGGSFSPVMLPARFSFSAGASFGWFTNFESREFKDRNNNRITGDSISNTLKGASMGINMCYKLVCAGYGQTISINPVDKSYKSIEFGLGFGGSGGAVNQDYLKGGGE